MNVCHILILCLVQVILIHSRKTSHDDLNNKNTDLSMTELTTNIINCSKQHKKDGLTLQHLKEQCENHKSQVLILLNRYEKIKKYMSDKNDEFKKSDASEDEHALENEETITTVRKNDVYHIADDLVNIFNQSVSTDKRKDSLTELLKSMKTVFKRSKKDYTSEQENDIN